MPYYGEETVEVLQIREVGGFVFAKVRFYGGREDEILASEITSEPQTPMMLKKQAD